MLFNKQTKNQKDLDLRKSTLKVQMICDDIVPFLHERYQKNTFCKFDFFSKNEACAKYRVPYILSVGGC